MDALAAATATATAVSSVGSHFMLDGPTYVRGAELGFSGLDFYIAGRGGVLGDVDADIVTAAFAFFAPEHVRAQWDAGRAVMPPAKSAEAFAECCATWAETHVPDDFEAARLAELAGLAVDGARVACAPVFAGWRTLPVPASPKAAAVHQMNALRELRHGLHAAAIATEGLTPLEALSVKTPHMAPLFGWSSTVDTEGLLPRWETAEARTNVGIAHAFEALDEADRDELVELAQALNQATAG